MDFTLRCNHLKCRTDLSERAVVTTCSHVFCLPCSESLGLSHNGDGRICPACHATLDNADDAVVTQLNPSEDYKTSVLSGLSPSIIIECAGRALNFYSYQTTQEITYQVLMNRNVTAKYATLNMQMDKIIHDANSQIGNLQDRLAEKEAERVELERKNYELAQAFREKAKQHSQTMALYQKLKQQQLAFGMEHAAQDDADQTLQAAATGHFVDGMHGNARSPHSYRASPLQNRGRSGSHGDGASRAGNNNNNNNSNVWHGQAQGSRNGLYSSRSAPVAATPSGHRTRLPAPLYGKSGIVAGGQAMPQYGQSTPHRQPLGNIDANAYGHNNGAGYGMSAGVKVGRQMHGRSGIGIGSRAALSGINIR